MENIWIIIYKEADLTKFIDYDCIIDEFDNNKNDEKFNSSIQWDAINMY